MDNLRKFATENEYSAATLNYPAVSWVVSGDTIHYDKTAPTPSNVQLRVCFFASNEEPTPLNLYECVYGNGLITGISVGQDYVEPEPITLACTGNNVSSDSQYMIFYDLSGTVIDQEFAENIGYSIDDCDEDCSPEIDFFIPSGITSIQYLPANGMINLILEGTTPPTISEGATQTGINAIYVPDSAVDTYRAASGWSSLTYISISPLSDYSGSMFDCSWYGTCE